MSLPCSASCSASSCLALALGGLFLYLFGEFLLARGKAFFHVLVELLFTRGQFALACPQLQLLRLCRLHRLVLLGQLRLQVLQLQAHGVVLLRLGAGHRLLQPGLGLLAQSRLDVHRDLPGEHLADLDLGTALRAFDVIRFQAVLPKKR